MQNAKGLVHLRDANTGIDLAPPLEHPQSVMKVQFGTDSYVNALVLNEGVTKWSINRKYPPWSAVTESTVTGLEKTIPLWTGMEIVGEGEVRELPVDEWEQLMKTPYGN